MYSEDLRVYVFIQSLDLAAPNTSERQGKEDMSLAWQQNLGYQEFIYDVAHFRRFV